MSPSTPITIPSTTASTSSSPSGSYSSSGLYVPIHKRNDDSASSFSPNSTSSLTHYNPVTHRIPIYTASDLLLLSKSPISIRISTPSDNNNTIRDAISRNVPEILMSRQQKRSKSRAVARSPSRRGAGAERRRNVSKVLKLGETNWRGMRAVPLLSTV